MKKIVLSLAGVLAATAFAPEAAAVPAFARQTGMACTACHFQHFPVLNSFGMSFKASGYTMMGSQGKIEGEHMSLPDTLNASMLLKARYQKTGGNGAAADVVSGTTTNSGQWQIPDEFVMLVGGRVSDNVGFMTELSLAGATTAGGAITAIFKLPIMFDMGGAQVGVVPFLVDNAGVAAGFELSSTGILRGVRWSEDRAPITAASFLGINNTAATGLAFVAKNDMGYINLTRWSPDFTAGGGAARQLRSNWFRIAATPTVADWNMHIGLGVASGTSWRAPTPTGVTVNTAGTAAIVVAGTSGVQNDTKASILDFQGQTQLGGKDFSLYASYGRAPGSGLIANVYNANPLAKTAWSIGAEYSVMPHTLDIGGAILRGDQGTATANKDNAWMVQGIYHLAQNVEIHASYRANSGSRYPAGGGRADSLLNLMLEGAW